jgi:hypothetical protein
MADGVRTLNEMSREGLFELVWSQSMITLAPQFGISDVALKKRCAKIGVPTPPRGYWAKLEAGKRVRKPPLPEAWSPERKKKAPPKRTLNVERLPPPDIDYSLRRPIPIIAATKLAARGASPRHDGLIRILAKEVLHLRVAPASVTRALWLWNQLLKKIGDQGFTFIPNSCSVSDGVEAVTLELKEMLSTYEAPRGTYEMSARVALGLAHPLDTLMQWAPTGVLMFRAEEMRGAGCSYQWRETKIRRLDDRIDEVVAGLGKLLGRKRELHFEFEEQKRLRDEESRLKEEARASQRLEEGRCRRLTRIAISLDRAESIRNLCNQIELEASTEQRDKAAQFVEWALRHADAIDPIKCVLEDLDQDVDPVLPSREDLYPGDDRTWMR